MSDRSPRRLAREIVLQALYAADCEPSQAEKSFADLLEEAKLSEKNATFARLVLEKTLQHISWADQIVSGLSANWDVKRIAVVDRIILRMALVELEHVPDTPVKVVLNEAIELARTFSTADSTAFVNGILDAYVKSSPPAIK